MVLWTATNHSLLDYPIRLQEGKASAYRRLGSGKRPAAARLVSQSEKSWDGGGSAAGLPHARFIPLFASYPISVAEIGSADWRWPVFRNGEWNRMVA